MPSSLQALDRLARRAAELVGELQRLPELGRANAWFQNWFPIYGDVAGLDQDGDGIACESLPGAPWSASPSRIAAAPQVHSRLRAASLPQALDAHDHPGCGEAQEGTAHQDR
jgi:hypothetical protein